jgi:hypothetical protein
LPRARAWPLGAFAIPAGASSQREKIVRAPDYRPARRRQYSAFERTPEQRATADAEALYALALWRAECAGRAEVKERQLLTRITRRPPADEAARRAQYAMQVARAEFGRFYWQDPLAGRKQPAKRPSNGAATVES